ncbi:helix-turn-helix domain-containing protein [Mycolicibacterium brisbanense]
MATDHSTAGTVLSDLITELAACAAHDGANTGLWPGLTAYRFSEPAEPRLDDVRSLSVGIFAHGTGAPVTNGCPAGPYQFSYAVISGQRQFACRMVAARADAPFLGLALPIDPAAVRKVAADMTITRPGVVIVPPEVGAHHLDSCVTSSLPTELAAAVVRFLRSLSLAGDRQVLAPLYVVEIVYRLLQHEQSARLLRGAARESAGNPITAALDYINANLAEPLTVTTLAAQVNLSTSAFSCVFRDKTGRSPYQFVKELRLDRARDLLLEGRLAVGDVSRAVGYTSASHFIKEFRGRFGATPRDYADARIPSRGAAA